MNSLTWSTSYHVQLHMYLCFYVQLGIVRASLPCPTWHWVLTRLNMTLSRYHAEHDTELVPCLTWHCECIVTMPNLTLWECVVTMPNLTLWECVVTMPNQTLWTTLWASRYHAQLDNMNETLPCPTRHCGQHWERVVTMPNLTPGRYHTMWTTLWTSRYHAQHNTEWTYKVYTCSYI